MRSIVTGSRLPILRECQYWARDDVAYTPPESGAAAGRGTSIHDAVDSGDMSKLSFEDAMVAQGARRYLQSLRDAGWTVETEVPLALNYVTGAGRRMKSSGHRDYSDLKLNEIPITVDYVAFKEGRVEGMDVFESIEVGDWKTGYGSHVDKTSENWQLGGACAALSAMYGDCSVTAKIHYLDNDYVDSWTFSAMEAQRFGVWIRTRVELTPTALPQPGDHCRYCPARVACPKTQTALGAILPTQVQWTLERISAENDAAMVMALPALKAAVDAVEKALKERNKSGLPLDNGKVWKPVLQTRSGYDTKRMAEALGPRAEEFRTRVEFESYRQVKA
jgi:hypothetical protein